MTQKKVKFLIMSVGEYEGNVTTKYLLRMKTPKDRIIVCLPNCYSENAASYERHGLQVYLYDEKKYINDDFEFLGFKPRNNGGVGRQGIAEAAETLKADDVLFVQLDDDYVGLRVRTADHCDREGVFGEVERFYNVCDEFWRETGIRVVGSHSAVFPKPDSPFVTHKEFNNFIMRGTDRWDYDGFKQYVSDDVRYNVYRSILKCEPCCNLKACYVNFGKVQGERKDGNAVIYNGDYAFKKAYALQLMFPWAADLRLYKMPDGTGVQYREQVSTGFYFPKVILESGDGTMQIARI